MLAEQVPPSQAHQKAKGPIIIESKDEALETTSRAMQGRTKVASRVQLVSPVQGASSVDGAEDGVFASSKCI